MAVAHRAIPTTARSVRPRLETARGDAGITPAIEAYREVGVQAMHARLRELTRYWVALARSIRGFRLHTPIDDERLAAVSLFSIDGADMKHVERELRERRQVHVKYRCVGPIEGLRVSPHVYTRKSELQRFVEALDRVLGPRGDVVQLCLDRRGAHS